MEPDDLYRLHKTPRPAAVPREINLPCYTKTSPELFTVVIVKNVVFWDLTSCKSIGGHRRFGGKHCLYPVVA
jgi:hypothetical protein